MKHFLIMSLFIMLFGCGKKATVTPSTSGQPAVQVTTSDEAPNDPSDSFTYHFSQNTPVGLGAVLNINPRSNNKNASVLCTWFLIDHDKALASTHCVPREIRESEEVNCGDFIQGAFKTKDGVAQRKCKKIKVFSKDIENYVLIEIDQKVEGDNFYQSAKSSFERDENLKIHALSISINKNKVMGTFKEHECFYKKNSIFDFQQSIKVVTAKENSRNGFKTIKGYTGAPVVNREGKVVGLSFSRGIMNKIQVRNELISPELDTFYYSVASINCINPTKGLKDVCETDKLNPTAQTQLIEKLQSDLIKEKSAAIINEQVLDLSPSIVFSLEQDVTDNEFRIFFTPKCVKNKKDWPQSELTKIRTSGRLLKYESYHFKSELYIQSFSSNYDLSGNLWLEFNSNPSVVRNQYELLDLAKMDGALNVKMKSILEIDNRSNVKTTWLPICSDEDLIQPNHLD